MRYIFGLSLAALMVVLTLSSAALAEDSSPPKIDFRMIEHEIVGEGTNLYRYDLDVAGGTVAAHKLEVDLNNPHVEIGAMHPEEGFNNKETVRTMARRHDAVAAVNADFFHLNRPAAPFGLHVEDGEILSSPSSDSSWLGFGVDEDRIAHILNWQFEGEVIISGRRYPLSGYNQTYRNEQDIFVYDRRWGEEVSSVFFDQSVMQVTVINGNAVRVGNTAESIPIPADGYVMVAEGLGAEFLQRHIRRGSRVNFTFDVEPDLDLMTAVGGQALLVEDGEPVDPSRLNAPGSLRTSRTAAGIDEDTKTVYFVTVDGNSAVGGVTMEELSLFLNQIGADRALNLDGGGSATMVARRLGEFDLGLINTPRYGLERTLPSAVGIFNRAPRKDAAELVLSGPDGVLFGSEAQYSVAGYDGHYHPLSIDPGAVTWQVSNSELASVSGGTLRAKKPGEVHLTVSHEGVLQRKKVKIFGSEDIANMSVTPEQIQLLPGQRTSLSVQLQMSPGQSLTAKVPTVKWESDIGRIEDGVFYADEEGFGTLTADVDGRKESVPVYVGGKREPFFTFQDWQTTSFRSHPEGLPGSFTMQDNPGYVYLGARSGKLEYDFSGELCESTAAYAQLGSGQISMGTGVLGMSAFVYGDGKGHWLRAEVYDADGRRHYVDLADSVSWEGWKRVQAEFDPDWSQPLTLSSVYLVCREERLSDADAGESTIYIDHIEMVRGLDAGDEQGRPAEIKMWIGSEEFEIRGRKQTVDAVPFIDNGRTLVPVRYLGEAFYATSGWKADPETGLTEKVTLENEDVLISLEIGQARMTVLNKDSDEEKIHELDVSPVIVDGRTYLPARAIAENGFSAEVDYSVFEESGRVESVRIKR